MKKKYFICLVVSALFLLPSICCAQESDAKASIKKEMLEGCFSGYKEAARGRLSEDSGLKFCQCAVNKTLEKYTVDDLTAIPFNSKKMQAFKKDFETNMASKECLELMVSGLGK